jgi:hypothetical protein
MEFFYAPNGKRVKRKIQRKKWKKGNIIYTARAIREKEMVPEKLLNCTFIQTELMTDFLMRPQFH